MKAPKSSNNNIFLKARDLGPTSLQSYFTLAWPTVCCTCRSSFCCCCCCCRCSGGYKNNWITEHLPLHTWPSLATFDGCCCNQPTRQPNQLTKKTKTNCDVAVVIVCILAFVASFFLFFYYGSVYPHWQHLISFIAGSGKRQPPKSRKTAKKEAQTSDLLRPPSIFR